MQCETLWVKAGTSKKPKYIPIHEVHKSLAFEQQTLEELLAYHAITGCHTVSYFMGHSKRSAWTVFPENHNLLQELGNTGTISDEGFRKAEQFICKVYKVSYDNCDNCRVYLCSPS